MQDIEKVMISEPDLQGVLTLALRGFGVAEGPAADAAKVLVMAEMMGITTHGAARVPQYGARLRIGGIKATARIAATRVAPALAMLDGDNGLGPAIGMAALAEAMEMARSSGIGAVFVRRSNHFGPIAPYALLAAEAGFASFIASNASTTIAPTGGAEARLGNNPLGFGFPNPGGDPVILDMAMSVVARAKIRNAESAGEPIPEGWATDAQGRPTTNPTDALKGFLLPVGGYKGYGLSLCVDLMTGMLANAAYLSHVKSWSDEPEAAQDLGHSFILIDTSRLMPTERLAERMEEFGNILHSTPRADAKTAVQLPGERELAKLKQSRLEGIPLPSKLLAELQGLAAVQNIAKVQDRLL